MSKIFKVTPGFYDGERNVDIIRLLREDDFTFETFAGNQGDSAWYNLEGHLKPEVHAQVVGTFPANESHLDRYRSDAIKSLHGNLFRKGNSLKVDFRGCATQSSREAKRVREIAKFEEELKKRDQELRDQIVKSVNDMIVRLASQENETCTRSHILVLTKEPWEGLDEKAGVAEKLVALKKAREDAVRLVDEIAEARNKAALEELTQDGWVIEIEGGKKVPMEPKVINVVKKAYEENTAFKSRDVRLIYGG